MKFASKDDPRGSGSAETPALPLLQKLHSARHLRNRTTAPRIRLGQNLGQNLGRNLGRNLGISLGISLGITLGPLLSRGLAQTITPGAPTPDSQADTYHEGAQAPATGGSNTGGPHAAVLDEQHRPITAGGFTKTGLVLFKDIAETAGLATWKHTMGTPEKHFIIETNGSGVGLLDYDNDGWLDIYLVNGSTADALSGKATAPKAALFHNNHDGTFTNVAERAGVTNERWGTGVAVADYDNDGWPDIFVTNFGKNRLYHNNHDGTFTDVAEKPESRWGTGRPERPGEITTATDGWTSSSPATSTTTWPIPRHPAPRRSLSASASFAV